MANGFVGFFLLFFSPQSTQLGLVLNLKSFSPSLFQALFPALASFLGTGPAGLGLVAEHLGTGIVGLLLVDVLHKDTLVLECITLNLQVQLVVQVLVNLLVFTVLLQHASENTDAPHPQNLGGHTGFLRTLPLTITHMATLPACLHHLTGTESRVHIVGLLDNETISDKLADVLARVSLANFPNFVGVEPDLLLAAS